MPAGARGNVRPRFSKPLSRFVESFMYLGGAAAALAPPPEPRRLHVGLWRERAAIPAPMASSNARHGSRTGSVRDLDTVAEFLVRFTRSNFPGGLQLPPPRAVPRAAPFALPFALRTPGGKSLTRGNLSLIGLCARRRRRNCATCWCSVNSGIRSF
jgi:hypothetical protein